MPTRHKLQFTAPADYQMIKSMIKYVECLKCRVVSSYMCYHTSMGISFQLPTKSGDVTSAKKLLENLEKINITHFRLFKELLRH